MLVAPDASLGRQSCVKGKNKLVWLWVRVLVAPQLQKSRGLSGDSKR